MRPNLFEGPVAIVVYLSLDTTSLGVVGSIYVCPSSPHCDPAHLTEVSHCDQVSVRFPRAGDSWADAARRHGARGAVPMALRSSCSSA